MTAPVEPCFLFIPASGPGGAGEYMRCLLVADALRGRWPEARVHFVVNGQAAYAEDVPYPALVLDSSPAHASVAVNEYIASVKPDVVIFDNTGRARQLRAAKAAGAACVFVSSRPTARRKGLRLSRSRRLDQHWIAQPRWATPPATPWERLKKHLLPHIETLHLDAVFQDSEPERRRLLLQNLGLEERKYLAFCAGGGGSFGRGPRASDVLLEAARAVSSRTGYVCVVVLGPNYQQATTPVADGIVTVDKLDNARLMDLLHDAEIVVTGGGDVLMQALVQCKPCIAFPVASDQPARIQRCMKRGLVQSAQLASEDIAGGVTALLADHPRRMRMIGDLGNLGMRNGLRTAVAAVERLLTQRDRKVAR